MCYSLLYDTFKTPLLGGVGGGVMYYVFGVIIIYLIIRKVTEPKVKHIEFEELKKILNEKKNYHFVDVRTPGEFSGQKVKGFKNIPLQSIAASLHLLSQDKTVVLLCATGARSMRAARILNRSGYTDIINVKGGLSRMT